MALSLRPYQADAIKQLDAAFKLHRGVIYRAPTASGKTFIGAAFAYQCREEGKRVLFICHRREILDQASAKFRDVGIPHGLIAAGRRMHKDLPVQLALVGSLPARAEGLDPDVIIIDECQHSSARTWRRIASRFPEAKRLGLTATPHRLDQRPLAPTFTTVVNGPTHKALRSEGFLSEFSYFSLSGFDLRARLARLKIRLGDYDRAQLGRLMNERHISDAAAAYFEQYAGERTALAFCVDVRASLTLVERFNEAGIAARHVDASTPSRERQAAIDALENGSIRVLSNCEIFTEGFDLPSIGAVILLRPTHSIALYLQMVGRAMRPNGDVVHILDHSSLVWEHGLPDTEREWKLNGTPPERSRRPWRKCSECSCCHEVSGTCPHCGFEAPLPEKRPLTQDHSTGLGFLLWLAFIILAFVIIGFFR